jgi:predicted Ser/Thr protein kinase
MAVGTPGLPKGIAMEKFCYPSHMIEKRPDECYDIYHSILLVTGDPHSLIMIDKGTDSIVFLDEDSKRVFKVKRLDTTKFLSNEGYVLLNIGYSSPLKIAPKVYAFNKYVVVMEYVEGTKFESLPELGLSQNELKRILCRIIRKAMLLDELMVNHGQLSRAYRHIIIRTNDHEPIFIDFGDSTITHKPQNLTSVWSFLHNKGLLRVISEEIDSLDFARSLKKKEETAIKALKEHCASC